MKVSKEEKKAEAIRRMNKLGIFDRTIRQFRNDSLINICTHEPLFDVFILAKDEDIKAIREFEQKFNVMVYLVIRSYTSFGLIDSYLHVSDHKEDWIVEDYMLDHGIAFAYCRNKTYPELSESRSIGFEKTSAEGLIRTW